MGPKQSSETRSKEKQFFDSYQIIQELQNQNIRFLQHKQTKKEYLLRELNYTSKQQYLKAIETIKNKREQLKNSDHVIPLTEYFEKEQDQYCSTFYKLYALYEYPQRTLDDEVNERNLRKNGFTETELWSILASCILGLSHLQKKGIKHGSLRSNTIFLSQEGLIKISDPFTTGCQTNYQTLLNKRNTRHIYLSPEQCEALQGELICPVNINPYKSDIFTLGMIILQSGLLQYQDQCYRDEYSRIHMETLEYNKNRFRKNYSEELAVMLNYMLGEDANSRPEWIELQNYVITDTSKSFISDPNKSNILTQSKPHSVNINLKGFSYDGINSQSFVPTAEINFPPKKPASQKISAEQKLSFNTSSASGKGIVISSLKPVSVKNFPLTPNPNISMHHSVQGSISLSGEKKPLTQAFQAQPSGSNMKTFSKTLPLYQNNLPSFPLSNTPSLITNLPNFNTQNLYVESLTLKQPFIKNFDIQPVNTSNISGTRPFRCIFPNPTYITKTKIDENLIQVDEDQQTSRSVSNMSHYNNNYSIKSQQNQNFVPNGQFNFNTIVNSINQSSYPTSTYDQGEMMTKFTGQSTNVPASNQMSRQNSHPPNNQFSDFQGQFVVETFKLGSRYEGYKLNGMRHGQGKFFYQDGGMYDGSWVKNKMEGYGKLYYQSGKIAYDGMWIQDQFTGHGILYNESPDPLNQPFDYQNFDNVEEFWTKYEGQFLEDSKNGKGILYLSNGEYFQGNFINDTAQGEGIYTTLTGKKIRGIWEMNLLQRKF